MKHTVTLFNAQQGHTALTALWTALKPYLVAGHRLVVEVRPETRTDAQNRLLHAWLGEISHSIEWGGKRRDVDTWRRLLVASWLRARGESVEVLPALDGHGIDIVWRSTTTLTKPEMTELCDYVIAWATEHGVTAQEPA